MSDILISSFSLVFEEELEELELVLKNEAIENK